MHHYIYKIGFQLISETSLSHDAAVTQWKHHMTTRVHVTSLTTSTSTMCFLIEFMFVLKAKKSHFRG